MINKELKINNGTDIGLAEKIKRLHFNVTAVIFHSLC